MIGKSLAQYQVEARLGAGGMGEVYQARDTRLGRHVAVKVLPEPFALEPDRIARLGVEARLLASLNHPNIASIYGLEEFEDRRFLVMELVPGQTLNERIGRRKMPVHEALKMAEQIADALAAAHEKGIVHRDLKPSNIKVTPDGKIKVLDFGLAKAMEDSPAREALPDSPTLSMDKTQPGVIRGTAAYMSPEQALGLSPDPRSDIFSFGCVVYEMLSGRQAFQGENTTALLAAVIGREPDFDALPHGLNPRITDLLRLTLQKNPKRRWQAAADVRAEIEAILADPRGILIGPDVTAGERPLWKRAAVLVTTVLVSSVAVGAFVWSLRPSLPSPQVTRFSFTLPAGQQFTNPTRQLVSISPDGTQFVYVANDRLYLKSMDVLEPAAVRGTELFQGIQNPVFSPDGKWLAFWSADRRLKRIPVSGGAAVLLCEADGPFGMSWGPDGAIVFGQGEKGIMKVSATGGGPVETIVAPDQQETFHGPQMLPGGKAVLFTVGSTTVPGPPRWAQSKVAVQFLDSGERRILIEGGTDARYVSTGHLIYALRGSLLAAPFDVRRTQVTGMSLSSMVEGVRLSDVPNSNTGTVHFGFSENGTLVYIPEPPSAIRERRIGIVDQNGRTTFLNLPVGQYQTPRISPDGKQLAVVTDDGADAFISIYPLSETASPRRLTFEGRNDVPAWFADSLWLLFRSNRDGDYALFRRRVDGSGSVDLVSKADAEARILTPGYGHLSGSNQLFTVTRQKDAQGEIDIFVLSMKDLKLTPFETTPRSEQHTSVFSPDGRWILYNSNESGRFEIWVKSYTDSDGAKFQITREGGAHPVWAPDGKHIYFERNDTLYSVAVQFQPTFSWLNPVALPITGFFQGNVRPRHYDITPDGKFIMIFPGPTLTQSANEPRIEIVLNWLEEVKQRSRSK